MAIKSKNIGSTSFFKINRNVTHSHFLGLEFQRITTRREGQAPFAVGARIQESNLCLCPQRASNDVAIVIDVLSYRRGRLHGAMHTNDFSGFNKYPVPETTILTDYRT